MCWRMPLGQISQYSLCPAEWLFLLQLGSTQRMKPNTRPAEQPRKPNRGTTHQFLCALCHCRSTCTCATTRVRTSSAGSCAFSSSCPSTRSTRGCRCSSSTTTITTFTSTRCATATKVRVRVGCVASCHNWMEKMSAPTRERQEPPTPSVVRGSNLRHIQPRKISQRATRYG